MIQEVIIHTDPSDIPKDYYYDTETPDFYAYRHKYTGDEIHIAKNPKTYINIQRYINKVLDKIRAEVKGKIVKRPWLDFEDMERDRNDAFLEVLDIIDKYRTESEDKTE